jgi:hypothetical protein
MKESSASAARRSELLRSAAAAFVQGGKESANFKLSRSASCGFDANSMWLAPRRTTKRPFGASDLQLAVRR